MSFNGCINSNRIRYDIRGDTVMHKARVDNIIFAFNCDKLNILNMIKRFLDKKQLMDASRFKMLQGSLIGCHTVSACSK